jgi:hypothetical protein
MVCGCSSRSSVFWPRVVAPLRMGKDYTQRVGEADVVAADRSLAVGKNYAFAFVGVCFLSRSLLIVYHEETKSGRVQA